MIENIWKNLNEVYFKNALTKPVIVFDDLEGMAEGYYHPEYNVIELDNSFKSASYKEIHDVILHEMIHQYQYFTGQDVCHDEFFRKELIRVGLDA